MNTTRIPRPSDLLSRLRPLGPILIVVVGLIVAACNNSGSGSAY